MFDLVHVDFAEINLFKTKANLTSNGRDLRSLGRKFLVDWKSHICVLKVTRTFDIHLDLVNLLDVVEDRNNYQKLVDFLLQGSEETVEILFFTWVQCTLLVLDIKNLKVSVLSAMSLSYLFCLNLIANVGSSHIVNFYREGEWQQQTYWNVR